MGCIGPAPEPRWFDLHGEPRYECPAREVGDAGFAALVAWRDYQRGYLPDAGGLNDQAHPFVQAIHYLEQVDRAAKGLKREG